MLQRLTISLVAACVLGIGLGPLAQGSELDEVAIGGRFEVPEAGYALTAPDGWVTIVPSAEDATAILDNLSQIDPDLAATAEQAFASGVSFSLLTFGAFDVETGFRENCNVIDYASDGDPVDVAMAADAAALADMGDRLASGPETALLELAAGDVARIDYGLVYPTLETVHAAYYFTDGAVFHLLTCTALERPEDDWLAVAETFEFLDAGE